MKAASIKDLKTELGTLEHKKLVEVCLRLAKHKKEVKELLTYIVYESEDEEAYIRNIKEYITDAFENINTRSIFFVKKSVRKILKDTKKFIRYSKKKPTEVELLMHFCYELKNMRPSYRRSTILVNVFNRQIALIKKTIGGLHEDLQYDYQVELEDIL